MQIVGGRKDLGKQGVVKRVNRERSTVIVAGLNMVRSGVGASSRVRAGRLTSLRGHTTGAQAHQGHTRVPRHHRVYGGSGPFFQCAARRPVHRVRNVGDLRCGGVHPSGTPRAALAFRLPTKVGVKFTEEGAKVRVARSSGTVIPRAEVLKERVHPRREPGPKDTVPDAVRGRALRPAAQSGSLGALRGLGKLGCPAAC